MSPISFMCFDIDKIAKYFVPQLIIGNGYLHQCNTARSLSQDTLSIHCADLQWAQKILHNLLSHLNTYVTLTCKIHVIWEDDVLSRWPKLSPIWYLSRANQINSCCLLIPKPLPDTMLLFSDLKSGNKFQLKHKTVPKGIIIWKFILLVILLDLNVPPRGNVGVWDMICRHWLCIQCYLSQKVINMCPLS